MSAKVKRGARLAIVPGRALRDRAMTPKLREVLMAIAYYADRDGWCVIRVALLGELLGKNADNLRGDIRRLVALGYVEISQRHGGDGRRLANGYQLVLDGDLPKDRDRSGGEDVYLVDGDADDPEEVTPLRAVSTQGGGSSVPRGVGSQSPGPPGRESPGLTKTKDTSAKDTPLTPICLRHRELNEAEQRALSRLPSGQRIPVVLVFGAWCCSALDGEPRSARLNATVGSASTRRNRADLISVRLDDGWPLADLVDAVQGWRESPHHRGANATETVYDDLALCLRDGAHIEKFRDLWRARPATRLGHLSTGEVAEEERRRHAAEVDEFWRREREREQAVSGGRR